MTNDDLIDLGFKPLSYFTIGNNVLYDLGRERFLSVGSVGTPNEMLFICEKERGKDAISDLICIHNYDYEGYLTKEKVVKILEIFKKK